MSYLEYVVSNEDDFNKVSKHTYREGAFEKVQEKWMDQVLGLSSMNLLIDYFENSTTIKQMKDIVMQKRIPNKYVRELELSGFFDEFLIEKKPLTEESNLAAERLKDAIFGSNRK